MSTYPRRVVIIKDGSLAQAETKYFDFPQVAYQPSGKFVLGYKFSGSGKLSITLQHLLPDGSYATPEDGALVSGASTGTKIDSYAFTWGTGVRWVISEDNVNTITGLYVWLDLA